MKIKITTKVNKSYALSVGLAGVIVIAFGIWSLFSGGSYKGIMGAVIFIVLGLWLSSFGYKFYIKKKLMEETVVCESYEILN